MSVPSLVLLAQGRHVSDEPPTFEQRVAERAARDYGPRPGRGKHVAEGGAS